MTNGLGLGLAAALALWLHAAPPMNEGEPLLHHFLPGRPVVRADANGLLAAGDRVVLSPHSSAPAPVGRGPHGRLPAASGLWVVARAHSRGAGGAVLEGMLVEVFGPHAGRTDQQVEATIDVLATARRTAEPWIELVAVLGPVDAEVDRRVDFLARTLCRRIGHDVPLHLTVEGELGRNQRTELLHHARWIAIAEGLEWVYTDIGDDRSGQCSWCPGCDALLVETEGRISRPVGLSGANCAQCGWAFPGRFGADVAAA